MNTRLCDLNTDASSRLPRFTDDKSGVGAHYVDAYLKPMNVTLADGRIVKCRRRGLKVVLSVNDRQGEGLLRRLDAGPDPTSMLDAALQEAASAAGVTLTVEDGAMFLGDAVAGDRD